MVCGREWDPAHVVYGLGTIEKNPSSPACNRIFIATASISLSIGSTPIIAFPIGFEARPAQIDDISSVLEPIA